MSAAARQGRGRADVGSPSPEAGTRQVLLDELRRCLESEALPGESAADSATGHVTRETDESVAVSSARCSRATTKRRRVAPGVAITDRYRYHESSSEELIIEMTHAGLPPRSLRRIAERLWGRALEKEDLDRLAEMAERRVDGWLQRPLDAAYPYVLVSRAAFGRELGGVCLGPQLVIVAGIDASGCRSVLAVERWPGGEGWETLWLKLRERGLCDLRLVIGPGDRDAVAPALRLWSGAAYQRCLDDFHAAVLHSILPDARVEVGSRLRRIHDAPTAAAARACANRVIAELEELQWLAAAGEVERATDDTLAYHDFPPAHHGFIRSRALLDRVIRQMRERHRVVGAFSNEANARVLVAAWFRRLMRGPWARPLLRGTGPLCGSRARSSVSANVGATNPGINPG